MEKTSAEPTTDDPRFAFAKVTEVLGELIEQTPHSALHDPTPCTEFEVKDLLDHVVMVMGRVAALGQGAHWSTIQQQAVEGGWLDDYRRAAHDVMQAWTDPAKLEQTYEVPWGEFPGAAIIATYTAELGVHAWDLATATGQKIHIDDELLAGALFAAKAIPAEGRDAHDMPFDPVVDPGSDAPVLLQMAGWMGRKVLG